MNGKTVSFAAALLAAFSAATAFADASGNVEVGGSVMGWMKPGNNVYLNDAQKREVAILRLVKEWSCAQMIVKADGGKKKLDIRVIANDLCYRADEWMHVAFVWRKDGSSRLYVNGKTMNVSSLSGDRTEPLKGDRLDEVTAPRCRPSAARDFRIEKRPLKASEILDEYDAACPVDIAIDDGFFDAGVEASATWTLAPAGALTRPRVAEGYEYGPAKVEIATEVRRLLPYDPKAKNLVGEEILADRKSVV